MTDDILKSMQTDLIKELHKRIKEGTASPSDLNVARQLLKDNNVGFLKDNHADAASLVKDLPFDPKADFQHH
jgi:hypothetical protein